MYTLHRQFRILLVQTKDDNYYCTRFCNVFFFYQSIKCFLTVKAVKQCF